MNPEAEVILNDILKKEPEALSQEDRAFLRARRSYLRKSQVEEYKEVLEATDEVVVENAEPAVEVVSYQDLLIKAKELGYIGPRLKRPDLEAFIADQERQKNPFN